jgi:hypothetical protein
MPEKVTHTNTDDKVNYPSESVSDLIKRIPELAQARDYGVDIPMLLANLNRPVIERIRRHQIALDTFEKSQKTKKVQPTSERDCK